MRLPAPLKVTRREHLPESVRAVADMLGDDRMMSLIEEYGGTRLSVPARVESWGPIVDLIGKRAARRLIALHAPAPLTVPLCKHWRAAVLREQGLSYRVIARRLGMHEHSVYRLLTGRRVPDYKRRKHPNQLRLALE